MRKYCPHWAHKRNAARGIEIFLTPVFPSHSLERPQDGRMVCVYDVHCEGRHDRTQALPTYSAQARPIRLTTFCLYHALRHFERRHQPDASIFYLFDTNTYARRLTNLSRYPPAPLGTATRHSSKVDDISVFGTRLLLLELTC